MSLLSKGFYLKRKGFESKTLSKSKILVRTIIAVLIVCILASLVLYFNKNNLIYYPKKGIELSPASIGWEFYDLYLVSTNGKKINAWYLPSSTERETILLLHGNGGNMTEMMGRVIGYHKLGFGIMTLDYQGYGNSEGSPAEARLYEDADTAYKYLTVTQGLAPERIIIHGFSLGGGVASWLALKYKDEHQPLILDSTFTTLKGVTDSYGSFLGLAGSLLLSDDFDTYDRLPQISPSKLLIFHSPADEVVPFALGLKNFEYYNNGPKKFIELMGGHMDYYINQEIYLDTIDKSFPKTDTVDENMESHSQDIDNMDKEEE
jgi:fermentation-respiration switch protein FrsA (DUF1100 family)